MIGVADGAVIEAVVILGRCILAKPCFRHIDVPFAAECAISIRPLCQSVCLVRRSDKVARLHIELNAKVRRGLYIWLSAHGNDAAARDADVAFKQLHNREAADILRANCMLRHAESVHDDGRTFMIDPDASRTLDIFRRHARDIRNHLDRIAAVEFFQARKHRIRRKEVIGLLRFAIGAKGITPRLRVRIRFFRFIKAGEQAIVKLEIIAQQAGSVRIAQDIILIELARLEHLRDDVAHKRDIRARTQLEEIIFDVRV